MTTTPPTPPQSNTPTREELRKAWPQCASHRVPSKACFEYCVNCAMTAALDIADALAKERCDDPDAHGPCEVNDLRAENATLRARLDKVNVAECPHLHLDGDEGPVAKLGRMPVRWRCVECGSIVHDPPQPPSGEAAELAKRMRALIAEREEKWPLCDHTETALREALPYVERAAAQPPAPEPSACPECGHPDEHDGKGCTAIATSGFRCACDSWPP